MVDILFHIQEGGIPVYADDDRAWVREDIDFDD